MNVLLDTHILLWWFVDTSKIVRKARSIISDSRNPVYVSAASLWELAIKKALGKLDIPDDLRELLGSENFLELDITLEHAWQTQQLPVLHRDPFDRMLIVQAQMEKLTIITRDEKIGLYDVKILQG